MAAAPRKEREKCDGQPCAVSQGQGHDGTRHTSKTITMARHRLVRFSFALIFEAESLVGSCHALSVQDVGKTIPCKQIPAYLKQRPLMHPAVGTRSLTGRPRLQKAADDVPLIDPSAGALLHLRIAARFLSFHVASQLSKKGGSPRRGPPA